MLLARSSVSRCAAKQTPGANKDCSCQPNRKQMGGPIICVSWARRKLLLKAHLLSHMVSCYFAICVSNLIGTGVPAHHGSNQVQCNSLALKVMVVDMLRIGMGVRFQHLGSTC